MFTKKFFTIAIILLSLAFAKNASAQDTLSWTFDPPPVNGAWEPGQVVTMCFTLEINPLTGANWLHGLVLTFPPGWDMTSITNTSAPVSCTGSGGGNWAFYLAGPDGPGFYYDSGTGGPLDGNPGNNWGDPCSTNQLPDDFTFCFDITVGTNNGDGTFGCGGGGNPLDGNAITPSVTVTGDGETGSWGGTYAPQIPVSSEPIVINCCDAESGVSPGTLPICETGTFDLFGELGAPVETGGIWTGPPGWTETTVGQGTFNPVTDPAGEYTYTVLGTDNCESSTTINMEFITFGTVQNVFDCTGLPVNIVSLVTNFIIPSGGTWTDPSGTPLVGSIVDPNVNPPGLYNYVYYDGGSCKTNLQVQLVFATGGAAGSPSTIDVCTSDAGCFSPFSALGGSPTAGGLWIVYDSTGIGFLDFIVEGDVCLNMEDYVNLITTTKSYTGDFTFVYVLPAAPCDPAEVPVTVNIFEPVNTGENTVASLCVTDPPVLLETLLDGNADLGLVWTQGGNVFPNLIDPSTYAPNTSFSLYYEGGLASTSCQSTSLLQLTILPTFAYAGEDNTINVCEADAAIFMRDSIPNNGTDVVQSGGTWLNSAGNPINTDYFVPGTSSQGTYVFTYNIVSPCASDESTLTIIVEPSLDPGISGTLDICSNETNVALSGGLTGSPAVGGFWMNASTPVSSGTVNGSAVTNGAVYTYTVGSTLCAETATVTINLIPAPNAGVLTTVPQTFCDSDAPISLMTLFTTNPSPMSAPGAGWTGPGAGGPAVTSVNPAIGSSASGVYTYTIPDTGCGPASVSITITITNTPNAGTDGTLNVCPNGTGTVNLFSSLGGSPAAGGTWTTPSGGSFSGSFNPATPDPAGVYTYTVGTSCTDQSTVTVTYNVLPNPGTSNTVAVCAGDAAFNLIDEMGAGAVAGSWTFGGSATSGTFTPGTSSAGVYTNTVTAGTCTPVTATLTVNVTPLPNAGSNATESFCESAGSVDLTSYLGGLPAGGGIWTDAGGMTIANPLNVSALCGNSFVYTYTVGSGTCSSSAVLTFDVICSPDAGIDGSLDLCSDNGVFSLFDGLTAPYNTGGSWSNSSGPVLNPTAIDPATIGTGDTFTYTVNAVPCAAVTADVVVTISPALTTANLDVSCTPSQTTYITSFSISGGSGPYTSTGSAGIISGGVFTSDPITAGTPFSVTISDGSACGDLTVAGVSPVCTCPATASFASADATICIGSSTDIEINLGGGIDGNYGFVYSDGTNTVTVSNANDGQLIPVNPAVTTTYTLVSVTDGFCTNLISGSVTITVDPLNNAGNDVPLDYCGDGSTLVMAPALGEPTTGTFSPASIVLLAANSGDVTYTVAGGQCAPDVATYTVNIDEPLATTSTQATCEANQTEYTVTIVITGGSGSYTVNGVSSGSTFTSGLIAMGTDFPYTIEDSGICGPLTGTIPSPNCSCPVNASFSTGNQTICIGSSVDIGLTLTGGIDGNYTVVYSGGTLPPNLSDGYLITVSPTTTTTYTLVSVTDGNCNGSVNGTVTVTVNQLNDAGDDASLNYCGDGTNLVLVPATGEPFGGNFLPATVPLLAANTGTTATYTMSAGVCPDDVATYTINIDAPITTSVTANCAPSQTEYEVTIVISGGLPPYSVDGSTIAGSTYTSSMIPMGTGYNFVIGDAGICGDATVTGSSPNCNCGVNASFSTSSQTICIGSSVDLGLIITGGNNGSYNVGYSANGSPLFVNNASDGEVIPVSPTTTTTYTLTSAEDNNCVGSVNGTVTITVEQLPNAGADVTAQYCADGTTLTLVPGTGQPTGGSFTPPTVIKDVANSGVFVYNMPGNVCAGDQANYNINFIQELEASHTAVCSSNQLNYTVTITIVGGVPPYSVDGNVIAGNTFSEVLVFAGNPTYDYTISDNGPCADVVISEIAPDCNCIAQGSITGTQSICNGSGAEITFNGIGDAPFNIAYSNSVSTGPPTQLTSINNGHVITVYPTVTTTYTLTSISDSYCEGVITGNSVTITVDNPVAITGVTEICNNTGEGYRVEFAYTGGVSPITFSPGNTSSTPGIYTSPVYASGNGYSITINGAGACPQQVISSIGHTCDCLSDAGTIPTTAFEVCYGESASVTTNNPNLDGNDVLQFILHDGNGTSIGNIIATSGDGTFNFNYGAMEPGAVYYITAAVGNNSGAGNVDLNGLCTSLSNGVQVVMNPLSSASISGEAIVCEGESVDLMVTFTGEAPYDFVYAIDGAAQSTNTVPTGNSFTLTVTQPGNYTLVSVSDNNCSGSVSGTATVQNYETPTATLSGEPTVCEGSGDGPQVSFTGNGPWNLVYSIGGVEQPLVTTNFQTYTIPVETDGNYALVSLEGSYCSGTVSGSQNVTILDAPTASITGGGTVCAGDAATFNVNLTGTSPWTVQYTVDGVPQNPLTGITSGYSFESSVDGDYVLVSVTDANCSGEVLASQAALNVNPLPTAEVTANKSSVCIGEELQLGIDLEGVAPYSVTYVLNGDTITATGLYSDFIQTLTPVNPVTFEVIYISDGSNPTCSSDVNDFTYIDAVVLPNAPVLTNDTICATNGPVTIGVNAAPGLTYSWSPETSLSSPNTSNTLFQPFLSGPVAKDFKYVLTATNGECFARDTMTITVDPGPQARFTYTPNPISSEDPTVFFTNKTVGRDNVIYFWEFDSLDTSNDFAPSFKFPDGINDQYTVTLTAIDPLTGCVDDYKDILKIKPEMLIYVPSAFTPDGDGKNDLWSPVLTNVDADNYKLTVYDRLGELVFTTTDVKQKWNGNKMNGSYYVESGVYVWMIETKNQVSLEEVNMKGIVTLVR